MRTNQQPIYDSSLIGVMTRLTHSILFDANARAERESARHHVSASVARGHTNWLDRLDSWFWKQQTKDREAFLARSIDVFDLEQRMRCLERGDTWLGTDRVEAAQ